MENRGGIRVTLERLAGDFILRTMRSHGETLRRRKCGNMVKLSGRCMRGLEGGRCWKRLEVGRPVRKDSNLSKRWWDLGWDKVRGERGRGEA